MSAPGSRRRPLENATRRAVLARDAGLERIRAVTRWAAAGVVALSGALALIAASSFHGHKATTTNTTTPPASSGSSSVQNSPSNAGSVQQPVTPAPQPTPVQQAPVVVSGGS